MLVPEVYMRAFWLMQLSLEVIIIEIGSAGNNLFFLFQAHIRKGKNN
jgi:hypothetical protein